jgi:hypothetical protein
MTLVRVIDELALADSGLRNSNSGLTPDGKMFTKTPSEHCRRLATSLALLIAGVVLVAADLHAETRWVGGFGLRLCSQGKTQCVWLSTGTELEVTGGRFLTSEVGVGTLYEVTTVDGFHGWISEVDLKSLLASSNSEPQQGEEASCTGSPRVGMSEQQALATCWGRPKYRQRVGVPGLMRDEWIYGEGRYLFFDDGKILAIQE